MKTYLKPILLAATLMTAGTAMAVPPSPADATASSPASAGPHGKATRGDFEHRGMHRGEGRGHHRFGGGALGELRGLNLSEAQREKIRGVLDQERGSRQQLGERRRELANAFDGLDPAARDYEKRLQGLSDQAAKLASDEFRARAQVRAKIQAQLTPAQVQALQLKRAERAAQRAAFAERRDGKRAAPKG